MRSAHLGDLEAIVAVHLRSWRHTYAGVLNARFLTDLELEPRRSFWIQRIGEPSEGESISVATAGDVVIGFVYTRPSPDEDDSSQEVGHIEFIHVDPEWQARGIGRKLLDRAVESMRQCGFVSASLWVLTANTNAQGFYEAIGWTADGTTKLDRLAVGDEPGLEVLAMRYRHSLAPG